MPAKSENPEAKHEDIGTRRWMIVAGACLMVLALLGVATTATVSWQNKNCTVDLVVAIQERGKSFDKTDEALRSILKSGSDTLDIVLDPSHTDAERIEAIKNWSASQRSAEQALNDAATIRKNNPLTQPRSC